MDIPRLIVLLIALGGMWSVWRRNPLYSLKSTLLAVAAMLIFMGALFGLANLIFTGPLKQNPVAEALTAITGFTVLIIAGCMLIARIMDAHVAQLPPEVRLQNTHRQAIQRWIWRFLIYMLMVMVACIVVPRDWLLPVAFGGGMTLLLGALILGINYMVARRCDIGMTGITTAPWVHWQYSVSQWEAWAEAQQQLEEREVGSAKSNVIAIVAVAGIFGGIMAVSELVHGKHDFYWILWAMAGIIVFSCMIYWIQDGGPVRRYRRIMASRPEAYLGDEGFYANGEYTPWAMYGNYLLGATVDNSPSAHLLLKYQVYSRYDSGIRYKRIPIPEGHSTDVPMILQKLATRFPNTAVDSAFLNR